MNKVWLIVQREFLNRVQKKSFLIATILIPMIFPAVMAIMIYIFVKQEQSAGKTKIEILDKSGKIKFEDTDRYQFILVSGDLVAAKEAFDTQKKSDSSKIFALLYIPDFELSKPEGLTLYTKENLSNRVIDDLKRILENQIHDLKLEQFKIDKEMLKSLKTSVNLNTINLGEEGEEKKQDRTILSGLGFLLGFLIYIFVMVYGMQIMLGVIEEKTSKIVEVLLSSVKPFQLMLGKILGIAAVGLLQFTIWIILIAVTSFITLKVFNVEMPQQQAIEQISKANNLQPAQIAQQDEITELLQSWNEIPIGLIIFNFAFYFLGGYLLYGSLFAAVGAAVDSQQEAQQFNLPLILPLVIGYISLFLFIIPDSDSSASFWFSIIPFTSPVAMVGRLAFGVPLWQLILSQVSLIGGFIFTTWIAARIYRVGILMHGSKVNFKVLAKWFMQRG